jgi:hypothetical protein
MLHVLPLRESIWKHSERVEMYHISTKKKANGELDIIHVEIAASKKAVNSPENDK